MPMTYFTIVCSAGQLQEIIFDRAVSAKSLAYVK